MRKPFKFIYALYDGVGDLIMSDTTKAWLQPVEKGETIHKYQLVVSTKKGAKK